MLKFAIWMLKELVELKVIFSTVLLENCFTAACSLDLAAQETAFLILLIAIVR